MTDAATTTTATTVETIEEGISEFAKFEPTAAMFAQMIPGLGPIVAIAQPFIPAVLSFAIQALDDIAKSNGGDIPNAIITLLQHLKAGQPNSPILSPSQPSASTLGSG